jgi:radical SAM superfamily enzyme YgiQ (UPF0313 family)
MTQLDYLHILCPPWGRHAPPLGPAYVLEAAERAGYSVAFVDLNATLFGKIAGSDALAEKLADATGSTRDLWDYDARPHWNLNGQAAALLDLLLPQIDEALSGALDREPALIGFSVYLDNLGMSSLLAAELHRRFPQIPIVFGGPWTTDSYRHDASVPDAADVLVFGEGEKLLPRMVEFAKNAAPKTRREKLVEKFGPELEPEPVELDEVPFPRYRSFELGLYQSGHISSMTTRGCPMRCKFCSDRIVGRRYRERSLDNVLDELELAHRELGGTHITFNDLNLGANVKRLRALAEGVLERGLDISYDVILSTSKGLTDEILAVLAKSGARTVSFGVESGSKSVLENMDKPFDPDTARSAILASKHAGLQVMVNFMVGYPGETEDDFRETLAFLDELATSIDKVLVNSLYILPGSRLADAVKDLDIEPIHGDSPLDENWRLGALDLKARVDRSFKLEALAKKHGIEIFQSNADITCARYQKMIGRVCGSRNGLSAIFEHGLVTLLWRGKTISAFPHLYVDADLPDGTRLLSFDESCTWQTNVPAPGAISLTATWDDAGFAIDCAIAIEEISLTVEFAARTQEEITLKRFKVGIALSANYDHVGFDGKLVKVENEYGTWKVLGPPDANGRLPLDADYTGTCERLAAESEEPDSPLITLRSSGRFVPVLQSGCLAGPSLGFYAYDVRLPAGKTILSPLSIDLAD